MAADWVATARDQLARGRYAQFVLLQRGRSVFQAEIAQDSVGTHVAGRATRLLGLESAAELPWQHNGKPPMTISAEEAEVLSEILIDEIRLRDPDKPSLSNEYVRMALLAAEFLTKGDCTIRCVGDWIMPSTTKDKAS